MDLLTQIEEIFMKMQTLLGSILLFAISCGTSDLPSIDDSATKTDKRIKPETEENKISSELGLSASTRSSIWYKNVSRDFCLKFFNQVPPSRGGLQIERVDSYGLSSNLVETKCLYIERRNSAYNYGPTRGKRKELNRYFVCSFHIKHLERYYYQNSNRRKCEYISDSFEPALNVYKSRGGRDVASGPGRGLNIAGSTYKPDYHSQCKTTNCDNWGGCINQKHRQHNRSPIIFDIKRAVDGKACVFGLQGSQNKAKLIFLDQ